LFGINKVTGLLKTRKSKHQIPNKSQIPNSNDRNYLIFPVFLNVLSSSSYTGLLFEILVIGICLLFAICYLEFPLS